MVLSVSSNKALKGYYLMKTEWDYTDLEEAYLKRPDYAQKAIERMIEHAQLK